MLILWVIVGFRHLKGLKIAIEENWELVDESMRKRHDLLPNLLETLRIYTQAKEELAEKTILQRSQAAHQNGPSILKIELEHDLSTYINEILNVGKEISEFGKDTTYLELKTEINDIEKTIETKVKKYNEMVRYYNNHRKAVFLLPIAALFKFGNINIFEFES